MAELKEGLAGTEPHTLSDSEEDLLTFYARTAALGLGSRHIHDSLQADAGPPVHQVVHWLAGGVCVCVCVCDLSWKFCQGSFWLRSFH